ncbi:3',5'-cyclic AMP phosphodiesterase CpdA [Roseivivax marinus]|uniref:metallophosphoesterase family protein n=1 Tax=Roseivivax marinus TaxID=1379903 RepID=UPI0008CB9F11|nr:metallophosphoesterase family protein [Roseivivax marinus]SEL58373.1 3',5'-cyclic AMP phosphodiesterase CpdA [Roseivivax marinus]
MTGRIAHLSDLHFGRDRPELVAPLIDVLNGADLDLVVVSGDLTQRARRAQFRSARAFLDQLEPPVLAVPGNHDTPLDNLAVRLLKPWSRFRRYVSRDLEPVHHGEGYVVAGMNTADPHAWQRGRIREASLLKAGRRLDDARKAGDFGVIAMHHPPEHGPDVEKRPMRGAETGLRTLADRGADIVLCGHLHTWRAAPLAASAGLLLVQAGTGLSTRIRGEPNDFNVLTLGPPRAVIERYGARAEDDRYSVLSRTIFEKREGRWSTCR